jgi:2-dehydro-3-deoxygalactonokinase
MDDPQLAHLRRRCLLILPGTHSKHVWIEDEKVVRFRTYMTGELFQVLATQSILRATTNSAEPIHKHRRTFGEGCEYVRQNGLAASLFQVRTRGVLNNVPPEENAAFLSGLLIGAETADILKENCPRVIAAKPDLLEPYSLALSAVLISQIDRATVNGHRMILANLYK